MGRILVHPVPALVRSCQANQIWRATIDLLAIFDRPPQEGSRRTCVVTSNGPLLELRQAADGATTNRLPAAASPTRRVATMAAAVRRLSVHSVRWLWRPAKLRPTPLPQGMRGVRKPCRSPKVLHTTQHWRTPTVQILPGRSPCKHRTAPASSSSLRNPRTCDHCRSQCKHSVRGTLSSWERAWPASTARQILP